MKNKSIHEKNKDIIENICNEFKVLDEMKDIKSAFKQNLAYRHFFSIRRIFNRLWDIKFTDVMLSEQTRRKEIIKRYWNSDETLKSDIEVLSELSEQAIPQRFTIAFIIIFQKFAVSDIMTLFKLSDLERVAYLKLHLKWTVAKNTIITQQQLSSIIF